MRDVIIETKGLTKDYGQGRGIFDIDLEIQSLVLWEQMVQERPQPSVI